MRAFLQKNGKELNALFIQLTKWCGHNCVGCYSLAHQTSRQLGLIDFIGLFQSFYFGPNYWANQITISVDKLSKDPAQKKYMRDFVENILQIIREDNIKFDEVEKPEVHFTVHSLEDLLEYQLDFSVANSIAFSTLKARDFENEIFISLKKAGVNIIYNLLAYNKSQVQKDIEIATDWVDNIHLVMFKNLLDPAEKAENTLQNYQEIYETVKNNKKVSIDRCYNASRKKTGCSAGTSLMQVWPDGSVSGCPYVNKSEISIEKAGNKTLAILDNIKNRQFQSCETDCIYKKVGAKKMRSIF